MKDYKNRTRNDAENDEDFFRALGIISSFIIIAIVIIACVFGAIDEARAETIDYVWIMTE